MITRKIDQRLLRTPQGAGGGMSDGDDPLPHPAASPADTRRDGAVQGRSVRGTTADIDCSAGYDAVYGWY